MSLLLTCKDLTKHVASKSLFEGLTLGIHERDRIGIVGENGSGKTTLLRMIAGLDSPDGGEVVSRKFLKVAYVAQQDPFHGERSIIETITTHLNEQTFPVDDALTTGAKFLSQVGFEDQNKKVGTLSGGWRKRLAIACGIAQSPDLLLLDEPTNHLDLESVFWLEKLVQRLGCAWVTVSHDRKFLDNCAHSVLEINKVYPDNIFLCEGNYSQFLLKREEYLTAQRSYAASLDNKVRREKEWLQRGPKARTTKSKSRIDEAARLTDELADVRASLKTSKAEIDFSESGRKTKKLINLDQVSHAIAGKQLFTNVRLQISPGSRIALVGANGSGKSTLMKTIAGLISPDEGQVKFADDLALHYFEQDRSSLPPDQTLKTALGDGSDTVIYRNQPIHITSWAKRFQFAPAQLDTLVGELSGGERARVRIAQLMRLSADVLLLDEPTNDLDIATLEILEAALQSFAGGIVVISHDRYMLETLCRQFVALDGQGNNEIYADLSQALGAMRDSLSAEPTGKKAKTTSNKPKRTKLSYNDQRELNRIEARILAAENELEEAQAAANSQEIATRADKLTKAVARVETAQAEVDKLYERWSELERLQEELQN